MSEILLTFDRELPVLSINEVAKRMKKWKKPTSTVPGDVSLLLYSKYPDRLAVPVTHIFNLITSSKVWPSKWKMEYITVIPKVNYPQEPSECRNIACTNYPIQAI